LLEQTPPSPLEPINKSDLSPDPNHIPKNIILEEVINYYLLPLMTSYLFIYLIYLFTSLFIYLL